MNLHDTPRYPRGFSGTAAHVGIKKEGYDLTLMVSTVPAAAAAVFTQNQVPGAPIVVGREIIAGGRLRGIVVNSRVANVGRGQEGLDRARRMGEAAAAEIGCDPGEVLMSSTGIIGAPLPIEKIEAGLVGMTERLESDPMIAARGIMTTDTHPKALSTTVGDATLTIVAKGSGMIAPNMATMLCYVMTDAEFTAEELDGMLRTSVDRTLNMLSVDSDTSTSDTCVIWANGLAGAVEKADFAATLDALLETMTEILARDGEGATRVLRVSIRRAEDEAAARALAKSIVDSPLIKTMVHGGDPNVGRILMAVGKCREARVLPGRIDAWVGDDQVVASGTPTDFDPQMVRERFGGSTVDITVDLGLGDGSARAWGCDLSEGYVEENGAYVST